MLNASGLANCKIRFRYAEYYVAHAFSEKGHHPTILDERESHPAGGAASEKIVFDYLASGPAGENYDGWYKTTHPVLKDEGTITKQSPDPEGL